MSGIASEAVIEKMMAGGLRAADAHARFRARTRAGRG